MTKVNKLLVRLDEIGQSLEKNGNALALIGLGSVGTERERLDEYSDLDFFAIVKPGFKTQFIDNLDWLSSIAPIAYHFKNTPDGYKLLYEDGVFCEFAVFEPDDLAQIPFTAGLFVWKDAAFDEKLAKTVQKSPARKDLVEWTLGEALTNLYVGLGRYHRGEKLTAMRFIQGYAVDRLMDLSTYVEAEQPTFKDIFSNERRYERRFPNIAQKLPHFLQGYERTPESARAILEFLDGHFEINPHIKAAILELCAM